MKKLLAFLLFLGMAFALLSAAGALAEGAAVKPFPGGTEAETSFGVYLAEIQDPSATLKDGYFTASLYNPDCYPLADIDGLKAGDTVQVDGQVFTVSSVVPHEEGIVEIYTKEDFDGYIIFQPHGEVYVAIVNDFAAATYVTDYKFTTPLPAGFHFYWRDIEEEFQALDADGFIAMVKGSSAPSFTRGYTVIDFSNGQIAKLIFSDMPVQIPEEIVRQAAIYDSAR